MHNSKVGRTLVALGISATLAVPALASTPARMMQECRVRAGEVLRTRLPNIDTTYEGQRTDGTHAVNGTARFNGRTETFQCSFNRSGNTIVQFKVNQPSGSSSNRPSRPSREPMTRTERVRFPSGTTGTTLSGALAPGDSVRYVLGARNRQFLEVDVRAANPLMHFNIFTPNKSTLYESSKARNAPYKGQLYLDGDHVVEVYNLGRTRSDYRVRFTLKNQASGSAGDNNLLTRVKADCVRAVAKQVSGGRSLSVIDLRRGENFFTVRVRVPGARAPWICEHSSRQVMRVYYGAEG